MSNISLSRLQAFYGDFKAEALLKSMINDEFKGKIALVSSFGADSAALIKLVADVNPSTPILFIDTGKHFKDTLTYVKELEAFFGLKDVRYIKPDEKLISNIDKDGELWKTQVNRCCWLRKVKPMEVELAKGEFQAIITGRKRFQTGARNEIDNVELFDDGIFRVNPFCMWNKDDVKKVYTNNNIPVHPLIAKGFPSIGCEPCTKEVKPGEDERSGRWAHTVDMSGVQKEECGIHTGGGDGANWMGGGV